MLPSDLETFLAEHGERLGLYTGPDFQALQLPPRKGILGPWLCEQSLTMLYAERGLGKSMLLMGLGLAVARGESFLGYAASEPQRVLYIDGEMPPALFQERLNLLAGGVAPENFMTLSACHAGEQWVDFADPHGRFQLIEVIQHTKPKVVILDNKSTLFSSPKENDADSWQEVQQWFINLRRMGIALILVHHSGKNGLQRGTSLTEVVLDTIIKLSQPRDGTSSTEGARFVLAFEKNRHFYGPDAEPRLVKLITSASGPQWHCQPWLGENVADLEEARRLNAEGLSQREIALRMGVALGKVNKLLNAA